MKLFNHVGLDPIEMSAEMVDGKRVYLTPEGSKFPSVTTVISNNKEKRAGIARWRERVGESRVREVLVRHGHAVRFEAWRWANGRAFRTGCGSRLLTCPAARDTRSTQS